MKTRCLIIVPVLVNALACGSTTRAPSAPPSEVAESSPTPAAGAAPADDARGGRLYDDWRKEKGLVEFVPDAPETPELDGKGGPHGNGTLSDGTGQPLPNTGHGYRLKNLFGWDLRGAEGIYGPEHQNKPYVLAHNLLGDDRDLEALRAWLSRGGEGLPALGAVLDERDLNDLVAFLSKTRAGELVRPELVFDLGPGAPKGFVLRAGGEASRGKQLYEARCSGCHGADGRELAIDESESVGTLARSSGYEIWFKIAHGQPGTPMGRQLDEAGAAAQAQAILDLFAALCDRAAFPSLASGEDVSDGDARCGGYLR